MSEQIKRPKVTDAVSLVADVVRNAYWNVSYHQSALKPAHNKRKWARQLTKLIDADPEVERAETDEDGEVIKYENISQLVAEIVDDAENSVKHHESGLLSAYDQVAWALILLAQTGYEVDVEKIKRQVESEFPK